MRVDVAPSSLQPLAFIRLDFQDGIRAPGRTNLAFSEPASDLPNRLSAGFRQRLGPGSKARAPHLHHHPIRTLRPKWTEVATATPGMAINARSQCDRRRPPPIQLKSRNSIDDRQISEALGVLAISR